MLSGINEIHKGSHVRAFFYRGYLVKVSVIKTVDQIVKRDEKILRKEKSYRRGRMWGIVIAVFTALVAIGISIGTVFVIKEPVDMQFIAISETNFVFWLAIAWICHQRLQHIQTIKLDRFCLACNYDLRGNPDATHCPECGAGVKAGIS